ncbi:triose-phosphate transporter [Phlyctema vagabunda]|uniref:Triose-phosphate transporter n=1 Tax=Phlyctema vagabunda TaxID=108571 RepID=A0ABR4PDB6_9HELO
MPHSTRATSMTKVPEFKFPSDGKDPARHSMERFPDHVELQEDLSPLYSTTPNKSNGYMSGNSPVPDRWQSRRDSRLGDSMRANGSTRGHGRQKSLSEALRNVRRRGSVSGADVQEIGVALRAPVSPKLVILCLIWYSSSALTNTSSKVILNVFPQPATLTMVQFGFVSTLCVFLSWFSNMVPALKNRVLALRHGIRRPSKEVFRTTLPMAIFSLVGHLLSSKATTLIAVSLVHTIKGLSPLFTVFAYRVVYQIHYPRSTYVSLVPLTAGVGLACTGEMKGGGFSGILLALIATLVFVVQNIFSKRIFNDAAVAEAAGQHVQSRKLDKLNLLCYSAGMAFVLTSPYWFVSEGHGLLKDLLNGTPVIHPPAKPTIRAVGPIGLVLELIFNGVFHFAQNIMAFVLLSMVSPVTYSVASLLKRIFVIFVAVVWFGNTTTPIQVFGIVLAFFGLYLYDRSSQSNKADRRAKLMDLKEEPLLPLNTSVGGPVFESPLSAGHPYTNGFAAGISSGEDSKKTDDGTRVGRARGASSAAWLPPGTKQEETWRPREISATRNNGHHGSVQ